MIVTIHQPEHLPWLGFFDKVRQSDAFVLLDNVQFRKNYFQNRNKIRTQQGWTWLTVPVLIKGKSDQFIQDVQINNTVDWQSKHWKSMNYAYNRAPYFEKYSPMLKQIYTSNWDYIANLNERFIGYLMDEMGIRSKMVWASTLNVTGSGTELLLQICQKLHAEVYLSGISGRDYLREEEFSKEGIKVRYQEFYHPIYSQLYEPFIPCMSTLDLLFNHGDKSMDILIDKDTERMATLFK